MGRSSLSWGSLSTTGVAEQFAITEATLSAWSSLDNEELHPKNSPQDIIQLQGTPWGAYQGGEGGAVLGLDAHPASKYTVTLDKPPSLSLSFFVCEMGLGILGQGVS